LKKIRFQDDLTSKVGKKTWKTILFGEEFKKLLPCLCPSKTFPSRSADKKVPAVPKQKTDRKKKGKRQSMKVTVK